MVLCVCSVCIPEAVGLGRLVPHCNPAVEHELQPEQNDEYRQQRYGTFTVMGADEGVQNIPTNAQVIQARHIAYSFSAVALVLYI